MTQWVVTRDTGVRDAEAHLLPTTGIDGHTITADCPCGPLADRHSTEGGHPRGVTWAHRHPEPHEVVAHPDLSR
ncbi:MAG: hypothetical protein ACRCZP_11450 [Phycicoccus sp.]